jgi:hypothetical protein
MRFSVGRLQVEEDEHPQDVPRGRDRIHVPRWWPEMVAFTIVGLPFIAAIVRALRGTPRLAGDLALTELAVRAVGSHVVLLGPYSRFGWNHPGPAYFYALAPLYWLLGANGRAITAGAIFIGLVAVCSILMFARRRGGPGVMLGTGLVVALLVWHLHEAAWSSWTAYVTILPVAAFVIAAWSLACVDRWALPVAAATGSFVIQTHIEYVPLVFGVGAAALVVCAVRLLRRGESLRRWRIAAAIAVGLFVMMWIPPTIDAIRHDPSNLDRLTAFREDPGPGERHTAGDGWTAATHGLSGFLDGQADASAADRAAQGGSRTSLITVGAVVAAGALAVLRRRWDVLVLLGLLVIAFAASVYAVSEVIGPLYTYLVTWMSVLSLMAWVAVVAAVVPEFEHARVGRPIAVVATALALATMILTWPGDARRNPTAGYQQLHDDPGTPLKNARSFESMISQVERRVPDGRPVVVRFSDEYLWPTEAALVAGLRDDGFEVHGERGEGFVNVAFEARDLTDIQPGDAVVTVVWKRTECGPFELCVSASR